MIVREILENRSLAENFDFFNDYKDTIAWLKSLPEVELEDFINKHFAMYILAKAYLEHRNGSQTD